MKKILILSVLVFSFAYYMQPLASNGKGEKLDYNFSHQLHVVEQELECVDCHEGVEISVKGTDDLLPAMSVCIDCHEGDEIKLDNPEGLPRIDRYNEKFSHKQHAEAGEDCMSCHADVVQKELVDAYTLPTMSSCMDCHENRAVTIECASCHQPFENLRPMSHRDDFTHHHGQLARSDARQMSADMSCATCHKNDFCQECHEGDNITRVVHPLNYEFTHAIEAQGKEKDCATCHTERQFCFDCHRDNQVLPHNHTVGWVNNFPNDGGRHKVEAMNDLEACLSCHENNAQEICQSCHGL